MTELLQRADFELALLIGVVLTIVVVLVLVARRFGPTPAPAPVAIVATTSSAVPADLAAIEAKIKALDTRVSDVEHGVNQVRTMMGALPTKDSVHHIALQVSDLNGDLKVNNASTLATARAVDRIEDWIKTLQVQSITGKAGSE